MSHVFILRKNPNRLNAKPHANNKQNKQQRRVKYVSLFISYIYIYICPTDKAMHAMPSPSSLFLFLLLSLLTNQVNSQNECLSCIASETCFKSDTAPQAADDDSCTPCAPATSTGGAGQNWWPCSVAGQCECRGSAAAATAKCNSISTPATFCDGDGYGNGLIDSAPTTNCAAATCDKANDAVNCCKPRPQDCAGCAANDAFKLSIEDCKTDTALVASCHNSPCWDRGCKKDGADIASANPDATEPTTVAACRDRCDADHSGCWLRSQSTRVACCQSACDVLYHAFSVTKQKVVYFERTTAVFKVILDYSDLIFNGVYFSEGEHFMLPKDTCR